jgi:hypothetical protein
MLTHAKYFYTTVSAADFDFCLKSTPMAICCTIHGTLSIQSQSLEQIVNFKYLMYCELYN